MIKINDYSIELAPFNYELPLYRIEKKGVLQTVAFSLSSAVAYVTNALSYYGMLDNMKLLR